MGADERTILRIRCGQGVSRRFKKLSVDYGGYEVALSAVMDCYDHYIKLFPSFLLSRASGRGKYEVVEK